LSKKAAKLLLKKWYVLLLTAASVASVLVVVQRVANGLTLTQLSLVALTLSLIATHILTVVTSTAIAAKKQVAKL
jgi:hypothetical protein